ncbi:MAG: monofunctional biosynthetic peptidoglycan transglycosylase, partial [Flavobacterium sp.]
MFRKITRLIWKIMLWFFGLSILSVIIFKWIPIPFTPLMVIRIIEFKSDNQDAIYSHDWVPL